MYNSKQIQQQPVNSITIGSLFFFNGALYYTTLYIWYIVYVHLHITYYMYILYIDISVSLSPYIYTYIYTYIFILIYQRKFRLRNFRYTNDISVKLSQVE